MPLFRRFPEYSQHEAVKCFKCGGETTEVRRSDFGRRDGEWKAWCPKCQLWTWYDFTPVEEEA